MFNTQGASSAYAGLVTTDVLPDVVGKIAFDPGWGHYELYGTYRTFRSRSLVPMMQQNLQTHGEGYGANVLVPLVPHLFDFQLGYLGGKGIGRYGSAQLPDATVNPNDGSLTPIRGYHFLGGLLFYPAPTWTLYAYGGREHDDQTDYMVTIKAKTFGYGYGGPLFSNADCDFEGGVACAANTSQITQGTLGGWWKWYQGELGNMQIGLQYTYVRREIFEGLGTPPNPMTNINIVELSFRFYPFQR